MSAYGVFRVDPTSSAVTLVAGTLAGTFTDPIDGPLGVGRGHIRGSAMTPRGVMYFADLAGSHGLLRMIVDGGIPLRQSQRDDGLVGGAPRLPGAGGPTSAQRSPRLPGPNAYR